MSSRVFFVGGNWKCNGSTKFTVDLLKSLNSASPEHPVDIVVAPPAPYLSLAKEHVGEKIKLAAQNCYFKSGAFTGEVSVEMLKDLQIPYVILGHSERRNVFNETDDLVGQKVKAAIDTGLKVIFCIGENKDQRKSGQTTQVISTQLSALHTHLKSSASWHSVVIAYEPVWAIGTGDTASPEQAQEAHLEIRKWLNVNVENGIGEKN